MAFHFDCTVGRQKNHKTRVCKLHPSGNPVTDWRASAGRTCHSSQFFVHNRVTVGAVGSGLAGSERALAAPSTMRCPKCQFDHELQTTECLKCGIVFSRYQAALEAAAKEAAVAVPVADAPPLFESAPVTDRSDALRELKCRLLALPLALLVARSAVSTGLRMPVSLLAMVLHESGHAVTAWLTGRWAVPMLWVTMHGDNRSWFIVVLVTSAIAFGGFLAWKAERWGWVCAAGALLVVQLIFVSSPNQGALVVFGGDGGAFVLATILMATFYAPRESALYQKWGLRWGLLVIGALTFMHVFRTWSGSVEDIPFGEIEGVNLSDPSLLVEMYGWSVIQLVDRYLRLATVCLVALSALYLWGLVSAYLETRLPAAQEKTAQAS